MLYDRVSQVVRAVSCHGHLPAYTGSIICLMTLSMTVHSVHVQVADFGSARFATQEGYHFAEQHPPERAGEVLGSLETLTVRFCHDPVCSTTNLACLYACANNHVCIAHGASRSCCNPKYFPLAAIGSHWLPLAAMPFAMVAISWSVLEEGLSECSMCNV